MTRTGTQKNIDKQNLMRQSTKELLKLKTDIPKGTCYGQRPLTSRQLAKKYKKDR
jgi:hypothetical protein